jgi:hypothetical protein
MLQSVGLREVGTFARHGRLRGSIEFGR